MDIVRIVSDDLKWVIEYWPDLAEARLPGTPRPWRRPDVTAEQRAEREAAARLERSERSELALGESPAPVDVGVLDLMTDVLWDAYELTEAIGATIDPPSTAYADPRPYLRHVVVRLDEDLAERAEPIARRMVDRVARVLAMVYDGQELTMECPWCRGVTPEHPAGGARTWRVRAMPGGLIGIVCENVCEPPMREVGTWWGGRPVWPMQDWERLARLVQAADERERMAS
jgi:hypothetical protein